MANQERTIGIKTATILKVVVVLLALWFLWLVRDIVALLFVALFLAALMHPAARWAASKRIPKGLMVISIYLFMISLFVAVVSLMIPTLVQQIGSLTKTIGSYLVTLSSSVHTLQALSEQYGFADNISAGVVSLQQQIPRATGGIFATVTGFFGGIAGFIVVMVMAYYMVVQDKEAVQMFHNLVPDKFQEFTSRLLLQLETKIGQWLTGQLVLSLIIGVAYYVGLLVLGIQGSLALAVFAGFTEFIPYLGPILGGIPIIIAALSDSPVKALFAFALVIIIQQLENQIIVPKVMQKTIGLNPLVSIVAVLIGAKLFGIIGVLLAIPVATALSVVLMELYRYKQEQ
jgi:predicted PurR-regulated permease PerM